MAADEPHFYGATNLILFSAIPNDDGSVGYSRITPELFAAGKKAQTENGIAVTVCVGGWGRPRIIFGTRVVLREDAGPPLAREAALQRAPGNRKPQQGAD